MDRCHTATIPKFREFANQGHVVGSINGAAPLREQKPLVWDCSTVFDEQSIDLCPYVY